MRCHISEDRVSQVDGNAGGSWYKGFEDEQFVCFTGEGWYVESREGEFGPFQSLKDAEDFYYSRFNH